MNAAIQAVLFDLGNTLMYAPDPWPPVYARAGKELADFLCAHGVLIDCEAFPARFLRRLDEYYSDRERAALAWTEAVTDVRNGHVRDEVFEEARKHFSEKELADLTLAVAAINAWNRLAIAARSVPGKYQPQKTRELKKGA